MEDSRFRTRLRLLRMYSMAVRIGQPEIKLVQRRHGIARCEKLVADV